MKKIVVLLFLIAQAYFSNAQLKALSFEHLTLENGLPENYSRCIIQDNLGYIWIGTNNGLVKYDGYKTKVYKLVTGKPGVSGKEQITSLFTDFKGTIWVGMRNDGLFRYNRGTDDFLQINAGTKADDFITNREVQHIVEDNRANLWIISYDYKEKQNQLIKYNPVTGIFEVFSKNNKATNFLPATAMYSLLKDSKQRVWVSTDNGVFQFDEQANKFTGYFTEENPSAQKMFSYLYEAPSEPGILWLAGKSKATGNGIGLIRFDPDKNDSRYYIANNTDTSSLPDDNVTALHEDYKKHLWIGTVAGISLLNRTSGQFANYTPADKNVEANANKAASIADDSSGGLWIVGGKGLLYFNPEKKQFTRYTANEEKPDALSTNNIEKIFIDAGGIIWITTQKFGLLRINKQQSIFTQYKNINGKTNSYNGGNTIHFAPASDKNSYWLATDKGLVHWFPLTNEFVKIDLNKNPVEPDNIITRVVLGKDGILWCGDLQKGLYSYNPSSGAIKNYQFKKDDPTSISSNYVRTLIEDKSGIIWVGTYGGGLCKLDKATGTFKRFPFMSFGQTPANGQLDDDKVASLYEDSKGVLWVGTVEGGLNRFDKETNKFISNHDTKNRFEYINGILEDKSGRFWISSFLYGLHLYDREKGTSRIFTEKEGLLCDVVQGFAEDRVGDLWVSSIRGLSRLNTKTYTFNNYTKAHGMPESNLSRGIFFTDKNELLVGCVGGFLSFSPDDILPNPVAPFINIESISYINPSKEGQLKNVLINWQNKIELSFNEKQISFHFTALHFNNPALNQYTYKLDGYDNDWVQAGTLRTATYTNLSPGTYTFFVRAANSDGGWSKTAASFIVVIHPPWWKTWWAYLIFISIAGIITWGAIKIYRSSRLTKENMLLEEKVMNRTKELKKSLEELGETQNQLIQREKMASLGELTAGIAHEIQNPLNFVNNFSEVNEELLSEMKAEINKGNINEAKALANYAIENQQKILHHGKRADAIVKSMLQHNRSRSATKEPADINKLADEYLRLAYHGFRAKDKEFNATMKTDFDETIGNINVIPQDIGRVILNLITNAFYVVAEKKTLRQAQGDNYEPTVTVSTKRLSLPAGGPQGGLGGGPIVITVADNGNGIPQKILDKIFQPFFTTKPTGQGTGLGLSLSYDIVKAHGGELKVETKEGEGSEFIISLPG